MKVAGVRVVGETQERTGWVFEVEVERDGRLTTHRVRLAWADYDYWCHGMTAPARVAETVVRFLAERESATLNRVEFDAARARREFPEIDELLPGLL